MTVDLDVYVDRRQSYRAVSGYTLKLLLPRIERMGVRYRFLDRFEPGDRGRKALLHIDLTDVPAPFDRIHTHYPQSINGHAISIRRTSYSTALLRRGDPHCGPVILKSVLNYQGLPELRYDKNRSPGTRFTHRMRRFLIPGYKRSICPPYRVFRSMDEIPEASWDDPRLIVEKFAPGSLDLPIVKHRYCFLFDTSLTLRTAYDDLMCDSTKVSRNEVVETVPAEVIAVREKLRLDFGAIDYFVVDGEVIVIDANKTASTAPSWMRRYDFVRDYIERIAGTLAAFARA